MYFSVKSAKSYQTYDDINSLYYSKMSLRMNLIAMVIGFALFLGSVFIFMTVFFKVIQEFKEQLALST